MEVVERTEKLKPFLHEMLKKISQMQVESEFDLTELFPLQVIINEQDETRKKELLENGIDSEKVVYALDEILKRDQHLHKCCVTEYRLSLWLDRFIAEVFRITSGVMPNDEKFEEFFTEFTSITYQEPFRVVSYSHLYNFKSDNDTIDFGDLKIQKLELAERAKVLIDNYTFHSLHPHNNIGEYFITSTSDELIEDDWKWIIKEREKAEWLTRVFQYFKDGLINLNYSAVYFYPEWINPIRQGGWSFKGEKRRFPYEKGEKMYSIAEQDQKNLTKWWNLFCEPEVFQMFTNERNNLGKVIEGAGNYYESSFEQSENIRKLVDLSITLESLFSPYNQNEISFQLSQLAAQLIGTKVEEKKQIFKDVKKIYGKRSKLLHGSSKAHKEGFIKSEEIDNFASILRQGILKFITLYIRGNENHKEVIDLIRDSLFDPKLRRKLKKDSDINRLIEEKEEE